MTHEEAIEALGQPVRCYVPKLEGYYHGTLTGILNGKALVSVQHVKSHPLEHITVEVLPEREKAPSTERTSP